MVTGASGVGTPAAIPLPQVPAPAGIQGTAKREKRPRYQPKNGLNIDERVASDGHHERKNARIKVEVAGITRC